MKITVAVIGCGRIAKAAHFPALSKIEGVRVKYACDIIEAKAIEAKEQFPIIENVVTDYHEVLRDEEVEAVFVLTPNYAHYTVTMDALRAGKHVMCEKPITVNYALSKEMADEARKQGKILNIGVCNRYNESVVRLAEMNKNGEFGNIYHVVCSFRRCRSIPGLGGAFTDKKQSGGGVLIDWGIHFLDLILYILGSPKLKTATCDAYCEMAKDMKSYKYKSMWAEDTKDVENGTNDVDDLISGYVRTENATISFNGAWAQNVNRDEMYIDFLGDKKGARLAYGSSFDLFDGETLTETTPEFERPNSYLREDTAFFESIESGIKNRNNIDNILESARLLDALYTSSDKREELKL